ncbi:2-phospho-L-lactate guanylyltransferase [[Eubacterium] cellulosolvens]
MSSCAIVPVHESSAAKTRLAKALSRKQRVTLGLAMLSDVLDALRRTKGVSWILLVTRDVSAAWLGVARGARVLSEGRSHGLNPAVRRGIRFAEREGADQVLIVPADVPLAKPKDFRRILRAGRKASAVIVPSYDCGGTNALLLRPPSVMPVSYGRNSFKRHCGLARKRRLRVRILKLASLQLDVDTPLDLARVRRVPGNTRSQKLLRRGSGF